MIFSPLSWHVVFWYPYCALFALLLPYFAFILTFFFSLSTVLFLSPFFLFPPVFLFSPFFPFLPLSPTFSPFSLLLFIFFRPNDIGWYFASGVFSNIHLDHYAGFEINAGTGSEKNNYGSKTLHKVVVAEPATEPNAGAIACGHPGVIGAHPGVTKAGFLLIEHVHKVETDARKWLKKCVINLEIAANTSKEIRTFSGIVQHSFTASRDGNI